MAVVNKFAIADLLIRVAKTAAFVANSIRPRILSAVPGSASAEPGRFRHPPQGGDRIAARLTNWRRGGHANDARCLAPTMTRTAIGLLAACRTVAECLGKGNVIDASRFER